MATYDYQPDYAVSPGSVLEEHLAARGYSHAEFARRCDRSAKLISEIVAGKAPVERATALQFEKVLGMSARIWLGIEADYRLHQDRAAEASDEEGKAWAERFPVDELVRRGVIDKPARGSVRVDQLLGFFGVATVDAWRTKYDDRNIAYRHSPTFQSDSFALATWLRLAELEAADHVAANYRDSAFKSALAKVRALTREQVPDSVDEAARLCNGAGVALALVKPLPKMRLSGAAWWLSPHRPIIALSARHKTDDHLWFSFFHEAAHILLHGKKTVFVDGANGVNDEIEAQANDWAANFLVPRKHWRRFVQSRPYSAVKVREFAEGQGIAPGIVVGSLQHEKRLPWQTPLNELKVGLKWADVQVTEGTPEVAVSPVETIDSYDSIYFRTVQKPSRGSSMRDTTALSVEKKREMIMDRESIFLSHRGSDKDMVLEYKGILEKLGYKPWLDDEEMPAGTPLERGLLKGMQESCAVIFFVTPDFTDAGFLETEINYALTEKRKKGDGFAIIPLVLDGFGEKLDIESVVPPLLQQFVWKRPTSQIQALEEILRALPKDVRNDSIDSNSLSVSRRDTGSDLSDDAKFVLTSAAEGRGRVICTRTHGGGRIYAGGTMMMHSDEPRERARWEAAVEELRRHGYLKDMGHKGEVFELTKAGWDMADSLLDD